MGNYGFKIKLSVFFLIITLCFLNLNNFASAKISYNKKVHLRVLQQSPCSSSDTINVLHYGAVGDGSTDDSEAFLKAWDEACNSNNEGRAYEVPAGKTFLLNPLKFKGPCKSSPVNFQIEGKLEAPQEEWSDGCKKSQSWIEFAEIDGLNIYGDGQLDGHGSLWWTKPKECHRPTALRFHQCKNLQVEGLTHLNSPQNHISINECDNVELSQLHVIAPEDSPNTDAIDISKSSNVHIHHSRMETGDDCVAINGGSSFIHINNLVCGPSHGISIGSLGRDGAHDTVEAVFVKHCTFKGSKNGARIKTWQGGSGFAMNITFEDIRFKNTQNPIIINQHYIDHNHVKYIDKKEGSAVQVSDVTYRNMNGTSKSEKVIDLECSAEKPCRNIVFENVQITSSVTGQTVKGYAENAKVKGLCSISPRIKLNN